MLAVLSVVAYVFFARATHEMLEPLLLLPEGQAAYAAALRRAATTIAFFDLPLILVVGIAAYVLARVSIGPLVRARESEERFAADAAHELRTPLATIAAIAQSARSGDESVRTQALGRITDLALEASALLGDLLALMRETPGETRLHEPVDVGALTAALVRAAGEDARSVALTLATPPAGAYVIGDERALRQLVQNLIVNALRHARHSVNVTVRADTRSIVLTVEDDGEGVAAADRPRIFERFYKAQPNSPGSGLGLAICHHIVTRHGGTIELEDRARFVASLPKAP